MMKHNVRYFKSETGGIWRATQNWSTELSTPNGWEPSGLGIGYLESSHLFTEVDEHGNEIGENDYSKLMSELGEFHRICDSAGVDTKLLESIIGAVIILTETARLNEKSCLA